MLCPLCESTQFEDHGKTVSGYRKFYCLVCQTYFTSYTLKNPTERQVKKLYLPEINFRHSASDRIVRLIPKSLKNSPISKK